MIAAVASVTLAAGVTMAALTGRLGHHAQPAADPAPAAAVEQVLGGSEVPAALPAEGVPAPSAVSSPILLVPVQPVQPVAPAEPPVIEPTPASWDDELVAARWSHEAEEEREHGEARGRRHHEDQDEGDDDDD